MTKTPFGLWRILAVTAVVVLVAGAIACRQGFFRPVPANSLMVILPYRHAGTWVFDDAAVGLRQEPFVAGAPEMIDQMVKDIPGAADGFRLLFSTQPFPGYTQRLIWRRGDQSGNWYYSESLK